LKWSIESAPVIAAPTLVHGDFSTRNILLRDGAVALIDGLGSICRSDPMEDLGSFFARVSRGRVQDRAAGGIGSREAFLAGYCDIAGAHSIAQDRIEYWAIVATLRAGIEASIKGALRGHPHSSEEFLCALEAQYDLLLDIAEAKAERR
jgi:aminoglycoside phosphotransferase (APT) family kinase protein